jgi:hypothetical protein
MSAEARCFALTEAIYEQRVLVEKIHARVWQIEGVRIRSSDLLDAQRANLLRSCSECRGGGLCTGRLTLDEAIL